MDTDLDSEHFPKRKSPPTAKEQTAKKLRKVTKSPREIVDETILDRYHQSQRLQGILKKQSQPEDGAEQEAEAPNATDADSKAEQTVRLSTREQREADQVLNDVNQLRKEKKKKLSKEKKQLKKKAKETAQQKEQQQANAEEEKEGKPEKALAYLKQWKKHKEEWKFKKNFHIWLLKNWKHSSKVPDKRFKTFLKYLKSTEQKSLALQRLEKDAKSIVDSAKDEAGGATETYERARSVLQWIL